LCIDCAMTCSHIIGYDPRLIGKWSMQSHPPWNWLPELQPWVPRLSYAHVLIWWDSHLPYLVHEREECHLDLKDSLKEKNPWGIFLWEKNFREIAVISCDSHLIGGH
jgi:hypothetical protein